MKTVLNGIFKENPTFILILGMCPALAVTTKFENAYLMGLCVLTVLIISSFIISLTKKMVPENVKIPVYILIIGTIVTIIEILLKSHLKELYSALGIYLPLIVVNCIVLGRALAVSSKSSIPKSLEDALGVGIGFTLSISLIALIREVIGTNTLTLISSLSSLTGFKLVYTNILPQISIFPISVLKEPAGAFLVLALLIALFRKVSGHNESN
ncbi:MAG: electron transport complex subunit RsxE [Bacilli bacterium]